LFGGPAAAKRRLSPAGPESDRKRREQASQRPTPETTAFEGTPGARSCGSTGTPSRPTTGMGDGRIARQHGRIGEQLEFVSATHLDRLGLAGGGVARAVPLELDDVLLLDGCIACDALLARLDNLVDARLADHVAADLQGRRSWHFSRRSYPVPAATTRLTLIRTETAELVSSLEQLGHMDAVGLELPAVVESALSGRGVNLTSMRFLSLRRRGQGGAS
jgi:hypothetical protein